LLVGLLAGFSSAGPGEALDWGYPGYPDDLDPPLEYQRMVITTHDSTRIAAWFVPAQDSAGATSAERRPGVLVLPREGETMETRLGLVGALATRGFCVLVFDHRGTGASLAFSPDPRDLFVPEYLIDAESALDILWALPQVDTTRVSLYGESHGAVLALAVAGRRPETRAVVAVSPPYNGKKYLEVLREQVPETELRVPKAWKRKDEPDKVVRRYNGAVFFIAGAEDTRTPAWMAEQLYGKFVRAKELWIVEGAGHDAPDEPEGMLGEVFHDRVAAFLTRELAKEPHAGWPSW
jgi:pimeloyl-ACP methyl ester carboxylesterase